LVLQTEAVGFKKKVAVFEKIEALFEKKEARFSQKAPPFENRPAKKQKNAVFFCY